MKYYNIYKIMLSAETHRNEFMKLVITGNENKCIEYINEHDDFYNATIYNQGKINMLQLVCSRHLEKVAMALIDKKCNIIYQDMYGWSVIMYAKFYGLNNVVTYIIDNITDVTTRATHRGMSEMMYICGSAYSDHIIKMIDRGYNIYYRSVADESLFIIATNLRIYQIVKKLIDIDTNFIDEFNTIYHNLKLKRDEFYYDITKYCADKRDGYKHEIIATMNDASPANALHQSFHTTYAVELVDIICDYIILHVLPIKKS